MTRGLKSKKVAPSLAVTCQTAYKMSDIDVLADQVRQKGGTKRLILSTCKHEHCNCTKIHWDSYEGHIHASRQCSTPGTA